MNKEISKVNKCPGQTRQDVSKTNLTNKKNRNKYPLLELLFKDFSPKLSSLCLSGLMLSPDLIKQFEEAQFSA
jgi:hypothetical protein